MNMLEDVIRVTKRTLAKDGRMHPIVVLDGTTGRNAVPLPDLPEQAKLSVLEALGYTLATKHQLGDLERVMDLVGWGHGQ